MGMTYYATCDDCRHFIQLGKLIEDDQDDDERRSRELFAEWRSAKYGENGDLVRVGASRFLAFAYQHRGHRLKFATEYQAEPWYEGYTEFGGPEGEVMPKSPSCFRITKAQEAVGHQEAIDAIWKAKVSAERSIGQNRSSLEKKLKRIEFTDPQWPVKLVWGTTEGVAAVTLEASQEE